MIGSTASRPRFPVTLDNWQTADQVGWTFCHIAEIFPTALISRGSGAAVPLSRSIMPVAEIGCRDADGESTTVGAIMKATETDGWMVVHDGRLLAEQYAGAMEPATLHLLMSVSKSIVGILVGALVGQGAIRVDDALTRCVPELAESGYREATVRHLLDMRSGIEFSEDYLDPDSGVRQLEQAIGWAPRRSPDVPPSLRGFLLTLRQAREHGGRYEYRSCETDVLGWVCEAAAGERFHKLVGELIWSRLGTEFDANVGVDAEGTGLFDGGMSAALCDLARFGAMIARDGTSLNNHRVVPEAWIEDSFAGGPDSREAFASSPDGARMPGGMYRNQFWFPWPDRQVLLCLGINGQMIYVDRATGLVAVKLSSWPTPQDSWKLYSTLAAFDAINAEVSQGPRWNSVGNLG
ncbi:MAG TPA: serine hydrolase [Propionibacteriaceae bacterium]|nr:serine hydrolase [Propionibacteriaceae bacterium]